MPAVDALSIARAAIDAAAEKKADDLLLLDLRKLSSVADYFVICSGNNDRQLNAITDAVEKRLREDFSVKPYRIEGAGVAGWVLMDFGDLVIHVFTPSFRAFYDLESLWAKAPVLLRMQ